MFDPLKCCYMLRVKDLGGREIILVCDEIYAKELLGLGKKK